MIVCSRRAHAPFTDAGVRNMQKALKITVDGVYGSQTAAAYKKFLEAMASLSG
jgi:lysozyme family protein